MCPDHIVSIQEAIARASMDARQDSIKRRKSKDLSQPAAAWLSTTRIGGTDGTALSIVLATIGCSHARGISGGCTMCSYLLDGSETPPSGEQIIKQFQNAMSKLEKKQAPLSVKLYTSGSFLDPDEVPIPVREEILLLLAKDERVTEVVIESRPDYVTSKSMEALRRALGTRRVEIGIGLESSNDNIRRLCINKGFSKQDFMDATRVARENDIGVRAYVLLKPPFLSEKTALDDALQTVLDCERMGVTTVSVNPVNIQKHTLVERLWHRGEFRPPWLWSLVELLKRARKEIDSNINIICDPVAVGKSRGVHNCGKCDNIIADSIKSFSLSQSVAVLDDLSCDCLLQWEHVIQHEEFSSLVHTDRHKDRLKSLIAKA